jgi:hypothetical protein
MGMGIGGKRPPVNPEHPSRVGVYLAAGGWQSMLVWWNPEGGYEEVWETGRGPYAMEADARLDAAAWSESWKLRLIVSDAPPDPNPAPSIQDHFRELFPMVEVVDLDDDREP